MIGIDRIPIFISTTLVKLFYILYQVIRVATPLISDDEITEFIETQGARIYILIVTTVQLFALFIIVLLSTPIVSWTFFFAMIYLFLCTISTIIYGITLLTIDGYTRIAHMVKIYVIWKWTPNFIKAGFTTILFRILSVPVSTNNVKTEGFMDIIYNILKRANIATTVITIRAWLQGRLKTWELLVTIMEMNGALSLSPSGFLEIVIKITQILGSQVAPGLHPQSKSSYLYMKKEYKKLQKRYPGVLTNKFPFTKYERQAQPSSLTPGIFSADSGVLFNLSNKLQQWLNMENRLPLEKYSPQIAYGTCIMFGFCTLYLDSFFRCKFSDFLASRAKDLRNTTEVMVYAKDMGEHFAGAISSALSMGPLIPADALVAASFKTMQRIIAEMTTIHNQLLIDTPAEILKAGGVEVFRLKMSRYDDEVLKVLKDHGRECAPLYSSYRAVVADVMTIINQYHTTSSNVVEPVCIWFWGPTGTGKSSLAPQFARLLNEYHGTELSSVAFPTGCEHFDGYNQQDIVFDDDKLQGECKDLNMFLNFISPLPMIVNKAALPDKGMRFVSKYYIVTSNFQGLSDSGGYAVLPSAFNRRRHIIIDCENKIKSDTFVDRRMEEFTYTTYLKNNHEKCQATGAKGKATLAKIAEEAYLMYNHHVDLAKAQIVQTTSDIQRRNPTQTFNQINIQANSCNSRINTNVVVARRQDFQTECYQCDNDDDHRGLIGCRSKLCTGCETQTLICNNRIHDLEEFVAGGELPFACEKEISFVDENHLKNFVRKQNVIAENLNDRLLSLNQIFKMASLYVTVNSGLAQQTFCVGFGKVRRFAIAPASFPCRFHPTLYHRFAGQHQQCNEYVCNFFQQLLIRKGVQVNPETRLPLHFYGLRNEQYERQGKSRNQIKVTVIDDDGICEDYTAPYPPTTYVGLVLDKYLEYYSIECDICYKINGVQLPYKTQLRNIHPQPIIIQFSRDQEMPEYEMSDSVPSSELTSSDDDLAAPLHISETGMDNEIQVLEEIRSLNIVEKHMRIMDLINIARQNNALISEALSSAYVNSYDDAQNLGIDIEEEVANLRKTIADKEGIKHESEEEEVPFQIIYFAKKLRLCADYYEGITTMEILKSIQTFDKEAQGTFSCTYMDKVVPVDHEEKQDLHYFETHTDFHLAQKPEEKVIIEYFDETGWNITIWTPEFSLQRLFKQMCKGKTELYHLTALINEKKVYPNGEYSREHYLDMNKFRIEPAGIEIRVTLPDGTRHTDIYPKGTIVRDVISSVGHLLDPCPEGYQLLSAGQFIPYDHVIVGTRTAFTVSRRDPDVIICNSEPVLVEEGEETQEEQQATTSQTPEEIAQHKEEEIEKFDHDNSYVPEPIQLEPQQKQLLDNEVALKIKKTALCPVPAPRRRNLEVEEKDKCRKFKSEWFKTANIALYTPEIAARDEIRAIVAGHVEHLVFRQPNQTEAEVHEEVFRTAIQEYTRRRNLAYYFNGRVAYIYEYTTNTISIMYLRMDYWRTRPIALLATALIRIGRFMTPIIRRNFENLTESEAFARTTQFIEQTLDRTFQQYQNFQELVLPQIRNQRRNLRHVVTRINEHLHITERLTNASTLAVNTINSIDERLHVTENINNLTNLTSNTINTINRNTYQRLRGGDNIIPVNPIEEAALGYDAIPETSPLNTTYNLAMNVLNNERQPNYNPEYYRLHLDEGLPAIQRVAPGLIIYPFFPMQRENIHRTFMVPDTDMLRNFWSSIGKGFRLCKVWIAYCQNTQFGQIFTRILRKFCDILRPIFNFRTIVALVQLIEIIKTLMCCGIIVLALGTIAWRMYTGAPEEENEEEARGAKKKKIIDDTDKASRISSSDGTSHYQKKSKVLTDDEEARGQKKIKKTPPMVIPNRKQNANIVDSGDGTQSNKKKDDTMTQDCIKYPRSLPKVNIADEYRSGYGRNFMRVEYAETFKEIIDYVKQHGPIPYIKAKADQMGLVNVMDYVRTLGNGKPIPLTAQIEHDIEETELADCLLPASYPHDTIEVYHEQESTIDEFFASEGSADPGCLSVIDSVITNYVTVSTITSDGNMITCIGLMLKGHLGVTVSHVFENDSSTYVISKHGRYEVRSLYRVPTRDVTYFEIVDKTCAQFPTITHQMRSKEEAPLEKAPVILAVPKRSHVFYTFGTADAQTTMKPFGDVHKWTVRTTNTYCTDTTGVTEKGNCGSCYFSFNSKLKKKILGIHCAGSQTACLMAPIFIEDLNHCHKEDHYEQQAANLTLYNVDDMNRTEFNATKKKFPHCEPLGIPVVIKGDQIKPVSVVQNSQTVYHHSLLASPDFPCNFEPAVLDGFDERLETEQVPFHILSEGMVKFTEPRPRKIDLVLLRSVVEEVKTYLQANMNFRDVFKVLTIPEALNGSTQIDGSGSLPMDTSPGFPWTLWGTKNKYLARNSDGILEVKKDEYGQHLLDAMSNLKQQSSRGKLTRTTFTATLKDEVLKPSKISTGATRVFLAAPLHLTILQRQYFLAVYQAIINSRNKHSAKVGIDPGSCEFKELFHFMHKIGNSGFYADYKNFDGSIPKEIMEAVCEIYNSLYKIFDKNWKPEDDDIRTGLYKHIAGPNVLVRNVVIKAPNGNPSGQCGTSIDNCIVNMIIFRYAYYKIMEKHGFNGLFSSHVQMACYGDDNIVTTTDIVKNYFNFKSVQQVMLEDLGMVITPADKESTDCPDTEVIDMDFLKRNFVKEGEYIIGRLQTTSIGKIMAFTKGSRHKYKRGSEPIIGDKYEETLEGLAYELCMYPEEVYNREYDRINKVLLEHGREQIPKPPRERILAARYYGSTAFTKAEKGEIKISAPDNFDNEVDLLMLYDEQDGIYRNYKGEPIGLPQAILLNISNRVEQAMWGTSDRTFNKTWQAGREKYLGQEEYYYGGY